MTLLLDQSDAALRQRLRAVQTLDDLAAALEITRGQLTHYSYGRGRRYRVFHVKKRRGGKRTIHEPNDGLKLIQSKLLQLLSAAYQPLPSVHGFVRGRSIVTNAATHAGQTWVLNIDLEEFFPTIHFGRVRGALAKRPVSLPRNVATVVAQLATWSRTLPQGAPTSPMLSNLVARSLDLRLQRVAKTSGCTYTRYADDITLSTDAPTFPSTFATLLDEEGTTVVGDALQEIVENEGFQINVEKVRLQRASVRQEVTGLTVNEFPNLTRRQLKRVRAMLYAWREHGYDAAEAEYFARYDRNKDRGPHASPTFRAVVKGHIDLIGMVRGWDSRPYREFIRQYADLVPEYELRHPTDLGPLHLSRWTDGIWVLDCEDPDDPSQGTAFELKGVGLVTCAHVLFRRTSAGGWIPRRGAVVYHPARAEARFPIQVVGWSSDVDLAVCRFDGTRGWEFQRARGRARSGLRVKLAGYPQYAPGAGLYEEEGEVTHERVHFGKPRLTLTCNVVGGASGAPVLNRRGEVVAVAAVGRESFWRNPDDPMPGAAPIELIDEVPGSL